MGGQRGGGQASGVARRRDGLARREAPEDPPTTQLVGPEPVLRQAERLRAAFSERLPLWCRTRCGLNLKALAALAVVLVVAIGLALHHLWSGRAEPIAAPGLTAEEESGETQGMLAPTPSTGSAGADGGAGSAAGASGKSLLVDVVGEVRKPGVHRLPAGSRVEDALRAAGGVTSGASPEGLNRARPVADGEQIVVAEQGEEVSPGSGGSGPSPPSAPAVGGVVSLNSATAEQLETLPGIGPVLAQQIVEFRTNQGGFSSVEQLREVSGIGDHRYATLRPLVGP